MLYAKDYRFLHLLVIWPCNTPQVVEEKELLIRLLEEDRAAQKWLYERYSPLFFSVCRRYLSSREDAEEALGSGFFKVFSQIEAYQQVGSFEGWMRRIMINEALMMLRRRRNLVFPGDEANMPEPQDTYNIHAELSAKEIMALLDELPAGYRTVFNLYVMEGYKHQEIADLLGISINTSKSQLILAKEKLKKLLTAKGISW